MRTFLAVLMIVDTLQRTLARFGLTGDTPMFGLLNWPPTVDYLVGLLTFRNAHYSPAF